MADLGAEKKGTRWIESIKEGHVIAIGGSYPLPAGWRERPDYDGKPAK